MKLKKDFTQIPNILIKDPIVSDGAFRTYVLLYSFKYAEDGKVFPSQKKLAFQRDTSIKTINNHLKELKKVGLINWRRRGFNMSNQYNFVNIFANNEDNFNNATDSKEKNVDIDKKNSSNLSLQKLQPNNTETKKTNINNNYTESGTQSVQLEDEKEISFKERLQAWEKNSPQIRNSLRKKSN